MLMLENFKFRIVDLGSVVGKNFKLFSSYDYAAFEFKPALVEDFFYKWNQLNPFHCKYDEKLAEIYQDLEVEVEAENKEYDIISKGDGPKTILEESEEYSQSNATGHEHTKNSIQQSKTKMNYSELFTKPGVFSKVEMNPDDPVEIGKVKIWIYHLDGFVYEIVYNRSNKEFFFKDDRVNWMKSYFETRKRKQTEKKRVKNILKLGELKEKISCSRESGENKYSLKGSLVEQILDNESFEPNKFKGASPSKC